MFNFFNNNKKHTIEEKKKILKDKILKTMHKEDVSLVQMMYGIAYTSDYYKNDSDMHDRLNKTVFKDLTDSELFDQFSKNHFNLYNREQLEHLFQEVHNRQVIAAEGEPKHLVSVRENEEGMSDGCMGYLCGTSNELNINAVLIEKAVKGERNACDFTPENVASQFLMVINHETQHGIQYQKELDFLVDEKMSDKDKYQAALNFMVFCVRQKAALNKDTEIQKFTKDAYWYVNNEHDANMAAIKIMKNLVEQKGKCSIDRCEALEEFVYYTLRTKPDDYNFEAEKMFIKTKRIEKMYEVAKTYRNHFDDLFKDCPSKDKILESVDKYLMKRDDNKSLYERDIIEDFKICDEALEITKFMASEESRDKLNQAITTNEDGLAF